ncbi:uncharacterized protein KD926_005129 [Aspergillus affinis]|uniref:uncharacterized protein n=1 Tax=Aspergillus affinis TaxID=1070780 RepID=UPI0022FE39FB|nr:uncharacterized protein KD926_005129 [Aspergillus affinis]KAI9042799.1 hypothetical protein KD926_005129 [Aspergillus affinis]
MCRYKLHHYPGCGHIASWGMEGCPGILKSMVQHKSDMYCENSEFTHDLVFGVNSKDCERCKTEPRVELTPTSDGQWQFTQLEGIDLVSKGYPFSGSANVTLGGIAQSSLSTIRCVLHRCLPMDYPFEPGCESAGSDDGMQKIDGGNSPFYESPVELEAPSRALSPSPLQFQFPTLGKAGENFLSKPNNKKDVKPQPTKKRRRPAPIFTNMRVVTDAYVDHQVTPSPDAMGELSPLPSPRFNVPDYKKPRSDPADLDDPQSPFGTRRTHSINGERLDQPPVNKATGFFQSPPPNQAVTPPNSRESESVNEEFELIALFDKMHKGLGNGFRANHEVSSFSDDSDDDESLIGTDAEEPTESSDLHPVDESYFITHNHGMFDRSPNQGGDTAAECKTTGDPIVTPKGVQSERDVRLLEFFEEWGMPLIAPLAPKKRYRFDEWVQSFRAARRRFIAQSSPTQTFFDRIEEGWSQLPFSRGSPSLSRGPLLTPPGLGYSSPLIPSCPVTRDQALPPTPEEPESVPPAKKEPWVPPRYRQRTDLPPGYSESPDLKSDEGVTLPCYPQSSMLPKRFKLVHSHG